MSPTDPVYIASEIAKGKTDKAIIAYFRWAVCFAGKNRPNYDDFTLGVEMGFAEWEHSTNSCIRMLRKCDYLKTTSHFAGMEFGETIAEALHQQNPSALQFLQTAYVKALTGN